MFLENLLEVRNLEKAQFDDLIQIFLWFYIWIQQKIILLILL